MSEAISHIDDRFMVDGHAAGDDAIRMTAGLLMADAEQPGGCFIERRQGMPTA